MSKIRFKVGQSVTSRMPNGDVVTGKVAFVVVRARLVAVKFPNRPDPTFFNFSDFSSVKA